MENQIACSSHFTRCCLPAYISHFQFMYCLMYIFKIQANRGKMLSIMRKRSSDLSQPKLAPHPHRPGEVLAPVTSTTAQRALPPPFLSFNPSHHRGESLLLVAQWEPNSIPPKGGTPRPRMNGWISASAPFLRKSLFSDAFSQKIPLRVQFC